MTLQHGGQLPRASDPRENRVGAVMCWKSYAVCHFCHSTGCTEQPCTVWEALSKGTDPGAGISGGHLGGWPPWCLRRPRCSWETWRTEAHMNRWALFSRLGTSLPGAGRLIWPYAWQLGYNFICLNPPPCLTVSPSYGHTVPAWSSPISGVTKLILQDFWPRAHVSSPPRGFTLSPGGPA